MACARPIKRPSSRRAVGMAGCPRASCRCGAPRARGRRPRRGPAGWCPDPGSNRDGPVKVRRIFVPPRLSPPAAGAAVRGLERAFTMPAARPVQVPAVRSLHLPAPGRETAWLGVASHRPGPGRGFADFDGIHAGRFRAGCSMTQVRCVCLFRHRGDAGRMVAAPSGAAVAHRRPARLRAIVSSSVKRRERVRKALPSGPSSEKVPPWPPSTTSMMSWVCFQYSYCWAPM